jgi:hypothetical protein
MKTASKTKLCRASKADLQSAMIELGAALVLALAALETEREHSWWRALLARGTERRQAERQLKRLSRRVEFICRELGLKPIPLPSERDGAKIRALLAADLATVKRSPR